jgi:hypothetical protein
LPDGKLLVNIFRAFQIGFDTMISPFPLGSNLDNSAGRHSGQFRSLNSNPPSPKMALGVEILTFIAHQARHC